MRRGCSRSSREPAGPPRSAGSRGDRPPGVLEFVFDGGTNVKPEGKHMHALTMTFVDADHLKEEWALYQGGKEEKVVTINLARKK